MDLTVFISKPTKQAIHNLKKNHNNKLTCLE